MTMRGCRVDATVQLVGEHQYQPLWQYLDNVHLLNNYSPQLRLHLSNTFNNTISFDFRQNLHLLPTINNAASEWNNVVENHRYCHYNGWQTSDGDTIGSHSALNICAGGDISGLLLIDGKHFMLENRSHQHTFLIPVNHDDCDWTSQHRIVRRQAGEEPKVEPRSIPDYYKDYMDGKRRYVELVLASDYSMYNKYDQKESVLHDRMVSIANIVNTLYYPLNVHVTLVWAEVWKEGDRITVSEDADQTLSAFLNYRKGLLRDHPHDNGHMLTNIRFGNGVVGKAFKGTMCSYDFSGGVDVDHSDHVASVAATIAHEMGHNLGMEHDNDECKCPRTSCIMAASTSGIPPSFWSDCSLEYLQAGLNRGVDYCLSNAPLQESVFGGAKCGNGILEAGEECDCGSGDVCTNKCCNWNTCKFSANAQCASGTCCDTESCKPKVATTVCRESSDQCDTAEYCDGHTEFCPGDFFVQDGLKCPDNDKEYCYNGHCGDRNGQCRVIWGPTGQNSPDICYAINAKGDVHGNCGYDRDTDKYDSCEKKDEKCGRLHCQHLNERTEFGDPSMVHTAHTFIRMGNGETAACRVVRMTYASGKQQRDPGMVPDGASCGSDKLCVKTKCTDRQEVFKMVAKCEPADCNGYGICNNVGNCHCIAGYGGVDCGIPGPGGSVNSGPAHGPSTFNAAVLLLVLVFIGLITFVIMSIYYRRKQNYWIHQKIWKAIRANVHPNAYLRKPVRKAPPPPIVHRPISTSPTETHHLNFTIPATCARPAWSSSDIDRPEISPPMPTTSVPSTGADHHQEKWGTMPYSLRQQQQPATNASTLQRQPSIRPKYSPPGVPQRPANAVLDQLYAERVQEIGSPSDNSLMTEVLSAYSARIGRSYDDSPPPDDPEQQRNRSTRVPQRAGNSSSSSVGNAHRPIKPPPPPPKQHHQPTASLPIDEDHYYDVIPADDDEIVHEKPAKPTKPPVAAKPKSAAIDVKVLAARFDPKSSTVMTKLC